MITRTRLLFNIITIFGFLASCTAERYISPTIPAQPRSGLSISPPILSAVFDARAKREPGDVETVLRSELTRIYGRSIEWTDYFSKTPEGRVSIRFRITTLGSEFDSILLSSVSFTESFNNARIKASGPWQRVIDVSSHQSAFSFSFAGAGWWNEAAWVDVEVQDKRNGKVISFILPIAAQHRESNTWGYSSGDKAARIAWNEVAAQIIRVMDASARTIQEGNP